jgi:drug/metabolite transporter (DMT)-like permease
VTSVLFAAIAGALFGVLAVSVRAGLARGADPHAGALVIACVGLAVSAVLAAPSAADGFHARDLWPFVLAGVLVPGVSQILFVLAVKHAGPSRAAILIGTAPVMSVVLALIFLDEPFKPELSVGTLLVVAGGAALARERARPEHFRVLGALLALSCAALFAVRDNVVRWAASDVHPRPLVAATAALLAAAGFNLAYVWLRHRGGLTSKLRDALPAFTTAGLALGLAYDSLLEAFDRGRVNVVAPLNATQSLWGVLLAALLVGRAEMIGRRTVLAGLLVVAGAVLIGATR